MKFEKAIPFVYKDGEPRVLGADFINTDAIELGVLSVVNKEPDKPDNTEELIAVSISQIQKLRKKYAKNLNRTIE